MNELCPLGRRLGVGRVHGARVGAQARLLIRRRWASAATGVMQRWSHPGKPTCTVAGGLHQGGMSYRLYRIRFCNSLAPCCCCGSCGGAGAVCHGSNYALCCCKWPASLVSPATTAAARRTGISTAATALGQL